MNILVTGSSGFLGKNLRQELYNIKEGKSSSLLVDKDIEIMECNSKTTDEEMVKYCQKADVVYHFAAVQRPPNVEDFQRINVGFTKNLIDWIEHYGHVGKIIFASSIQATLEGRFAGSPYGVSKKEAERLLCEFAERTKTEVLIYRFPGIFGKWGKPNYNSVVATFCHNISRGLPIQINDASTEIELVYIDDMLNEMVALLTGDEKEVPDHFRGDNWKYCYVPTSYNVTVGELAELIYEFKEIRNTLSVPDMKNSLIRRMWATYLSYLPESE